MRVAGRLGLAALFASTMIAGAQAKVGMPDGDWRTINRDLASTRYSPLKDINRTNVAKLAAAWSYPMRGYNTASRAQRAKDALAAQQQTKPGA